MTMENIKKETTKKIGIMLQITNPKKKTNIKKKSVVVIKNMKETGRKTIKIGSIILIMDIQDIHLINIEKEIMVVLSIKIILVEVIDIQNIKMENQDIILLLNIIKLEVLQVHLLQILEHQM